MYLHILLIMCKRQKYKTAPSDQNWLSQIQRRGENAFKVDMNPCDINHLKILVPSSLFLFVCKHGILEASSVPRNGAIFFTRFQGIEEGPFKFPQNTKVLRTLCFKKRQKMAQKEDRCLFHSAICHSRNTSMQSDSSFIHLKITTKGLFHKYFECCVFSLYCVEAFVSKVLSPKSCSHNLINKTHKGLLPWIYRCNKSFESSMQQASNKKYYCPGQQ